MYIVDYSFPSIVCYLFHPFFCMIYENPFLFILKTAVLPISFFCFKRFYTSLELSISSREAALSGLTSMNMGSNVFGCGKETSFKEVYL